MCLKLTFVCLKHCSVAFYTVVLKRNSFIVELNTLGFCKLCIAWCHSFYIMWHQILVGWIADNRKCWIDTRLNINDVHGSIIQESLETCFIVNLKINANLNFRTKAIAESYYSSQSKSVKHYGLLPYASTGFGNWICPFGNWLRPVCKWIQMNSSLWHKN